MRIRRSFFHVVWDELMQLILAIQIIWKPIVLCHVLEIQMIYFPIEDWDMINSKEAGAS